MAELVIRFDLKFDPRVLRLGMIGVMLLAMAPELASESVNLTTYYPAPSGVYTNLTVTGNAYLARDSGGVAIGTAQTPATDVMLIVQAQSSPGNTQVGIGTTSPTTNIRTPGGTGVNAMLDVEGPAALGIWNAGNTGLVTYGMSPLSSTAYGGSPEIFVNGDNHNGGGIAISDDGGFYDYNDGWIRYNGSTGFVVDGNFGPDTGDPTVIGSGGYLTVTNSMVVGSQAIFPGSLTGQSSSLMIDAFGVIKTHQGCGVPVTYGPGTQNCPGGYATNVAGIYAEEYALGDVGIDSSGGTGSGTMLCCPCPQNSSTGANVCGGF